MFLDLQRGFWAELHFFQQKHQDLIGLKLSFQFSILLVALDSKSKLRILYQSDQRHLNKKKRVDSVEGKQNSISSPLQLFRTIFTGVDSYSYGPEQGGGAWTKSCDWHFSVQSFKLALIGKIHPYSNLKKATLLTRGRKEDLYRR